MQAAYDEPRPWLALVKNEGEKSVKVKTGNDLTFDFNTVSKTAADQTIHFKASVTGVLPAGWSASIVADGVSYADTANIALAANTTKVVSVKISGPNDGVLNKKISIKLEANSTSLFPTVKNSLTFVAVSPSNVLFMDLAGTGTSRYNAGFTFAG